MSYKSIIRNHSLKEANRVSRYLEQLRISSVSEGQIVATLPVSALDVTQDSSNRFVTDVEKSAIAQIISGDNLVVTTSNTSLAFGTDYIFTGTTAIFTLPLNSSGNIGRKKQIAIKNKGTGVLSINTNNSANIIFTNSLVNTISLAIGDAVILFPDNQHFNIL